MVENWKLVLHEKARLEITKLTAGLQGDFRYTSRLLIEFGHRDVGMPHVKHIAGKLWEMRLKDADNIARVIYLAQNKEIVVLHAFIKKTQKTPKQALDTAQRRMKEVRP